MGDEILGGVHCHGPEIPRYVGRARGVEVVDRGHRRAGDRPGEVLRMSRADVPHADHADADER